MEQGLEQPKQGQGPGDIHRQGVSLQKARRAILKKLRWWLGRRAQETRGLAGGQQLPKTLSNDCVFDQGGRKNLRPKSKQGHIAAASLCGAGIARGDGNRHKR